MNETTRSYTGGSTILKCARAAASLSFTRERLLTMILRNMSLAYGLAARASSWARRQSR